MKLSSSTKKYLAYVFCCSFGVACTFAYLYLAGGTFSNVSQESEVSNSEEKIPRETLETIWEKEKLSKDLRAENISLEVWKKIVGDSCVS